MPKPITIYVAFWRKNAPGKGAMMRYHKTGKPIVGIDPKDVIEDAECSMTMDQIKEWDRDESPFKAVKFKAVPAGGDER